MIIMSNPEQERIIETLSHCDDFGEPREYYHQLIKLREAVESDSDKQFLIQIIHAMGHRDRFLIVDTLREKDRCVCELEAIIGKSQGTISRHLKVLEDINLIKGWKHGKFTHYSLIKPIFNRFLALVNDWLGNATNWFGTLPIITDP